MIPYKREEDLCLYFGCWDERYPVMLTHTDRFIYEAELYCRKLPSHRFFDRSQLLLPHPEVEGAYASTYFGALDITILSWWESTFSGGPGTHGNCHIIVNGPCAEEEIWVKFRGLFRLLAPKLKGPGLPPKEAIPEDFRVSDPRTGDL